MFTREGGAGGGGGEGGCAFVEFRFLTDLVSGVWEGIWCNVKNLCAGASEYVCTV